MNPTISETTAFTDRKRYLWLFSAAVPAIPMIGIGLVLATGNPLFAFFAIVFDFVFIPLLDALFGEDPNNPPRRSGGRAGT